jgi:hypothetical protein
MVNTRRGRRRDSPLKLLCLLNTMLLDARRWYRGPKRYVNV